MAHPNEIPQPNESSAQPVLNLNTSSTAATTAEGSTEANSLKCDEYV